MVDDTARPKLEFLGPATLIWRLINRCSGITLCQLNCLSSGDFQAVCQCVPCSQLLCIPIVLFWLIVEVFRAMVSKVIFFVNVRKTTIALGDKSLFKNSRGFKAESDEFEL